MNELLDFCRVKKIDEKGFGFLKSLYFPRDVFFHFNQIKKEDFKEKLQQMKRGEFFLYFVSKELTDGRRKAVKIWYSVSEVPRELIPAFTDRLIIEFNQGHTNLYDLIFAFSELKKSELINEEQIKQILTSKKILSLPTTITPVLNSEEIKILKSALNLEELEKLPQKPYWFEEIKSL